MDIVQLVESEIVLCIDVVNGEYETYGDCDTVSNVDRYASALLRLCNTSKNKYDSLETQIPNLDMDMEK
jgi:hypothetical protein